MEIRATTRYMAAQGPVVVCRDECGDYVVGVMTNDGVIDLDMPRYYRLAEADRAITENPNFKRM